MRLGLDGHARPISKECFQLVGLVSVIQNETEVVKPVLNELEVIRLSASLGVLPSVNPEKDFDHGLLADDFDDEFTRYLQHALNGGDKTKEEGQLRVLGLFGRQGDVKKTLDQFGFWSSDKEHGLDAREQGIYCVKPAAGQCNDISGVSLSSLVLFAWIQDSLLDPTSLRDTATYILRFLACMTSDIQCCLSPHEAESFAHAPGGDSETWSPSFSVGFCVKKETDVEDGLCCDYVDTVCLPRGSLGGLRLLKGKYPAVSYIQESPQRTYWTSSTERFSSKHAFADWIVKQAKNYSLKFNHCRSDPVWIRDFLLEANGFQPNEDFKKIRDELTRSIESCEQQSREEVNMQIEEWRAEILSIVDQLFSLERLLEASEGSSMRSPQMDPGNASPFETLHSRIEKLRQNIILWRSISTKTQVLLELPLRLKNQMKGIFSVFQRDYNKNHDQLSSILAQIPYESKRVTVEPGLIRSLWYALAGKPTVEDDLSSDLISSFRQRMADPLRTMQQEWWTAIESVLLSIQPIMFQAVVSEHKTALERTARDDVEDATSKAFAALQDKWRANPDSSLKMEISVESSWNPRCVSCSIKKEAVKPRSDELHVLKLVCDTRGSWSTKLLGSTALNSVHNIVGCFTIRCSSVLIVSSEAEETEIARVSYNQHSMTSSLRGQSASSEFSVIQSFPRQTVACDFNAQARLMAFVTKKNTVFIYRFSDNFEKLELTKRFDGGVHTSLSTVVDVSVAEDSIFLIDDTGAIQSINFRSLQTSKKVEGIFKKNGRFQNAQVLLPDGLALAHLNLDTTSSGLFGTLFSTEYTGVLRSYSTEDFRDIPTAFPARTFLCDHVEIACIGDKLFTVDSVAGTVMVFNVGLTVRSDSFRIRHSTEDESGSEDKELVKDEHWLRVLYHMYEKFPVGGLITCVWDQSRELRLRIGTQHSLSESTAAALRSYLEWIMNDLQKLNKSLGSVDLLRNLHFIDHAMNDTTDVWKALTPITMTSLVQNLVTFVPVQICRAEGNTLSVMKNRVNESSPQLDTSSGVHAADIARSIRFGLLSPLLNAWKGPVVVITSMGKQSTGKSYMLNHLTGTSFAIAGARCTDGAWMSLRILPMGVMLVVLDFEGLGSFERSEQEDVLLSVLNASISMFTIFRMEMRFDKEMDDLFARFQKGVTLMKSDSRLFRGMLYMSVKDVNPNDQKGVMDEFVSKLERLLGANKEHNFLTDLYSGKLKINCSPPLGTLNYFKSLNEARDLIQGRLCDRNNQVTFITGKSFLDCIRLVLAKISILDWTSLDESSQQLVLSEAVEQLPGFLRAGALIPLDCVTSEVLPHDRIEKATGINDDFETVCMTFPAMAPKWVFLQNALNMGSLPDEEIDLGFDVRAVTDGCVNDASAALEKLLTTFMKLSSDGACEQSDQSAQARFDDFVAYIVRRRCVRISAWAKIKFSGRVPEEWKLVEQQQLARLTSLIIRCQTKCDSCGLGCMKSAQHVSAMDGKHNCNTDHRCHRQCSFCSESSILGKTPSCSKEAGHEGVCECQDGDHTCALPCYLSRSPNCGKKCVSISGHDGLHHCGVSLHTCGEMCSLPNCSGRCILSTETLHTAHKCIEVACIEKCIMDGCQERCSEMDHFHGHPDVSVAFSVENVVGGKPVNVFDAESVPPAIHMCNKEHSCQAQCGEAGICKVDVFLKQSSKTFEGARGKFRYTYQEMNGTQKKCSRVLAPKQQTHDGKHSCIDCSSEVTEENDTKHAIHYCDTRCPSCSYFCNKEYNHSGAHATAHGNMRNTHFLADLTDVDIGERKYQAGEAGEAEMCNLFCSKMGRGHVHYLKCEQKSEAKCVYSGSSKDQRRHCTRDLQPKPEHEMDELLHEQYWRTLGWEDPCTSSVERELFGKCAYQCGAPEHSDKPSFCVLPAWHDPVSTSSINAGGDGFSYAGGHKFECSHVAANAKNHHIFVLDCSGSMHGQPWNDLMAAVREYVSNLVSSGSSLDIVSIVTFDSTAELVYEAQNVTLFTRVSVPYRGGGTSYATGLRLANEVMSRTNFAVYKPVIVFFSDGHPFDAIEGERLGTHLKETYEKYGLQAFAVGFGSINLSVLERVADRMGGTYHTVLTGTEMKAAFHSISVSLSSRVGLALNKQPAHEMQCTICCKDLASGDARKLPRCVHKLHKACIAKLVTSAAREGGTVQCPVCRAAAD